MDATTLLTTNALLSSAAAVVMAVVLRTRKTYPGFGFWTAGIACLALGAALLIPGLLPASWAARVGRNGVLLTGHLLLFRGMLKFRGARVGAQLEVGVSLLFLLPFAYLSIDPGMLSARIVAYCLLTGSLSLATIVIVLRRRPPHFGSNDMLLALWLLLFAFITFARAAQELANVSTAYETIKSFGNVYALAQILSVQLITLTLVSMNSQRIEWEHRTSADRLNASEQQLRSMGDNLPAGFIYRYQVLDGQGRFDYVSGGIESTLGLQPAEVIADAQPLFELLSPESRERYVADEARSAADLSDFRATLRFDLRDGRTSWLELRARPQRQGDGATVWDGVALDVTERRRAEEDLSRYKSLVDSSEDAIISRTLQGIVTSWNHGAQRLFGYSADEAVGRVMDVLVPAARAGEERDLLQSLARGEQVPHFQTERLHRDGHRLVVSVAVSPILDHEGRIVGASMIARDITERIAARERAVRQARIYLCLSQCNAAVARCETQGALFDAICSAIVEAAGMRQAWVGLLDEAGGLAMQAQAGIPMDATHGTGLNVAEALDQSPARMAMRSGQPVWCDDPDVDLRLGRHHEPASERGRDGWAALPVRRAGEVVGALMICANGASDFDDETKRLLVDLAANISFALDNFDREAARRQAQQALIAHRQQLEETIERRTRQLAEASEQAQAANVAKTAFLANMSHEIRTPLNAMIGMTHLIRGESLSTRQADRLVKLESAAKHLLEILNDVLDLSKIEAGKMMLEAVPVNVESMVANGLSMMAGRAEEKSLRLRSEVDPMPHDLVGDPTRLQQALLNYVSNAVKFTEQGEVVVRARVVEQNDATALLRFEVQDTGIGIDAAVMPRLFAAFEQADPSTTRRVGGTGLGLAITRRLALLMGGEVGATSRPGTGSTFWFTARMQRVMGSPRATSPFPVLDAKAALRKHHRGARVLLAEDNDVNAEVAQALLEDAGLVVDHARDGEAAVEMVLQGGYELVMMDMQMPRLDGLAASRTIRQHVDSAALPIIAMTANAFDEDKAQCRIAGMDDFVSKPVDPAALYELLLRWLEREREDASV
ncbi:PAS domain S-box protein [Roseateles amylovorans]|uniref:histidine kinase n=1 Tax=Roseateles amylovorans TaxID=2978473 RepID=A0ABY6AVX6_9BURK|nr:PAS domain S-box protein [Roseateles amylovorans]UXH76755.1 PAS domain S-box protein [Roseateles amylovorans]